MDHPFLWDERYVTKINEIDHQHQEFFQMAAQLDSAHRNGRADSIIDEILDMLVEHMISHFTAEEYLMEQHRFPNLTAHRHEHRMLAQKLANFNLSHKAGRPNIPSSLLAFLQSGMLEHILKADKEYSEFLSARWRVGP